MSETTWPGNALWFKLIEEFSKQGMAEVSPKTKFWFHWDWFYSRFLLFDAMLNVLAFSWKPLLLYSFEYYYVEIMIADDNDLLQRVCPQKKTYKIKIWWASIQEIDFFIRYGSICLSSTINQ